MKQSKVPGILGGMGPGATRDLYALIIKYTPASSDQNHLELLMHSYPHLDRTAAILGNGDSPLPTLIASANKLKETGADFLAVPCNTAHFFLPEVEKLAKIEIIDMIQETSLVIEQEGYKKVGLLSTSATAQTKLYQNKIATEVLIPSASAIDKEMEAIYGKKGIKVNVKFEKAKHNKDLLKEVIEELKQKGAEAIIMGCTEIPLCLEEKDSNLPLINPTEILAKSIVEKATAQE